MLDAAGLSFPEGADGKSLLTAGEGTDNLFREYIVCETHGHLEKHFGRAVITQRYKYIYNFGQKDELYDLCSDPYELNNLAQTETFAPVLKQIQKYLVEWAQSSRDTLPEKLGAE